MNGGLAVGIRWSKEPSHGGSGRCVSLYYRNYLCILFYFIEEAN